MATEKITRQWKRGGAAGPPFTPAELASRAAQRRAVEAVIWGMPVVNFDLMYQAAVSSAKAKYNQIVYWSRLPSWKNQTLTPNPDSIYLMPFINTKDAGPMVLEIPPAEGGSITGTVMDAWQSALEDVGPAGVDEGKGAAYLILPPDFKGEPPADYIVLPSDTFAGYALLRSILSSGSDADVAKAVAYGKTVRLYPLKQAANPPRTAFVDAVDVVFDATIMYDHRFFESLDRMVQSEPWLTRDKVMIDMLKSIGIEKGKPFKPDGKMQGVFDAAAAEAHAWLNTRYEEVFSSPFYERSHWTMPASQEVVEGMQTFFAKPDAYPVDGRGVTYSFAFFSAKHLGAGQYYLMTINDKSGKPLHGRNSYRLSVPANAPVTQYWSATAYDRETHSLIRDLPRSSRSSRDADLQTNANGSVDVFLGPKAPQGKDANWIPTNAEREFEVLFRFYGPEKPLFDKAWRLPDIEQLSG